MRCPVILDVDYDFFFNSENCITDFPAKVIQRDILESFSNIFKDVSFEKVVSHEEALTVWDQNNYQDITCLHIDYHHDWHVDRELLKSLTLYSIEEVINCANYAAIAAKFGIIKNFIWIRPDNHVNYDIIDPKKEFSLNKVSFTNMTWSEFVNLFSQNIDISIIDSGIMCLSPDFIPEKNMWEFFTKYKCSDEFVSRALIYVKEALFNHRFTIQKNNSDWGIIRGCALAYVPKPLAPASDAPGGERIFFAPGRFPHLIHKKHSDWKDCSRPFPGKGEHNYVA